MYLNWSLFEKLLELIKSTERNFTKTVLENEVDDNISERFFDKINGLKNSHFFLPTDIKFN